MSKDDEQLGYGPGVVYVIYGECDAPAYPWIGHAHKIGMTIYTAERRAKEGRQGYWTCSKNLRVVHQIETDSTRILEAMFHRRYRRRKIITHGFTSEWFRIDDKIAGLCATKAIYIQHALHLRANGQRIRVWWNERTPGDRRDIAADLWSDALIEWDDERLQLLQTENYAPTPIVGLVKCQRCGDEFVTSPMKAEMLLYCEDCARFRRKQEQYERRVAQYVKRPTLKPSGYTICQWCGRTLPSGFGPYCSRECVFRSRETLTPS